MTPEEFKSWRKRMHLTQEQASGLLGLSPSTVLNYERGTRREDNRPVEIPLNIACLCAAHHHLRDMIDMERRQLEHLEANPGQMESTIERPEWTNVSARAIAQSQDRLRQLSDVVEKVARGLL